MGLQDVQPGTTDNACKTCGQTAIVQLQYSASSANHSPDTATVQGDPTARRRAVDQTYSHLLRHHLVLLAGSALLYRDPTTLGPPVGPWDTMLPPWP
jgi:hypothetical protein